MSGIVGFTWEDKQLVTKALQTIKHRGPDGLSGYVDSGASLGYAHRKGKGSDPKPYTDAEGTTIVLAGSLHNAQDIREDLEKVGKKFDGESHAELILCAWKRWGRGCLEKLHGNWAFCILEEKQLTLVVDPYGGNHLYYAIHRDTETKQTNSLVFASEIHGVREVHDALGIPPKVSDHGLRDFLTFGYTLEHTLLSGIRKLAAGQILIFDLSSTKYSLEDWHTLPSPDAIDTGEAIERLKTAIPIALSNTNAGILLTDTNSALLTHAIGRKEIPTYAVGFSESAELEQSLHFANELGTKHTSLEVEDDDARIIDTLVRNLGQPHTNTKMIFDHILSQKAETQTVLTSTGMNELFGGHEYYKYLKYAKQITKIVKLAPNASKSPFYQRFVELTDKDEFEQHVHAKTIFREESIDGPKHDISSYKAHFEGKSILQKAARFDLKTDIPHNARTVQNIVGASGSHIQSALLTPEIVNLGLAVSDNAKIRLWNEKWILGKAFPNQVQPQKELTHPSKPSTLWFAKKGLLREQLGAHLDNPVHKLYNVEKARNILRNYSPEEHGLYTEKQLFGLLTFEIWYRQLFS